MPLPGPDKMDSHLGQSMEGPGNCWEMVNELSVKVGELSESSSGLKLMKGPWETPEEVCDKKR